MTADDEFSTHRVAQALLPTAPAALANSPRTTALLVDIIGLPIASSHDATRASRGWLALKTLVGPATPSPALDHIQ